MANNDALWYVVHTYSGYENKVAENIQRMVETRGLENLIFETRIPTEIIVDSEQEADDYVEASANDEKKESEKPVKEKKPVEHKLFPSYVLVKMVMNDETWHVVRNISGVTGFVGPGSRPVPLTDEEALAIAVEEQVKLDAIKIGDEVEIIDGFLTGHKGIVSEISEDASEVTVIVSTIGREMPVNLDAKAIKKV